MVWTAVMTRVIIASSEGVMLDLFTPTYDYGGQLGYYYGVTVLGMRGGSFALQATREYLLPCC